MSIRYALAESPYRWLILAGIAFTGALVGTIFIFAFEWSHTVARIWLYAGSLITLVFLVLAFLDWKRQAEEIIKQSEARQSRGEAAG